MEGRASDVYDGLRLPALEPRKKLPGGGAEDVCGVDNAGRIGVGASIMGVWEGAADGGARATR